MPATPKFTLTPGDFRWGQWVTDSITAITAREGRSRQDAIATQKGVASSVAGLARSLSDISAVVSQLSDVVNALVIPQSYSASATGFNVTSGWNTYASVSFIVPEGKTRANIFATGGAAAVDLTSGGTTSCSARIQIGSSSSVAFQPAKDAGASAVNNILTPSHGRSYAVTPGATINVTLQLNPLNAAAFPTSAGNYASLNALALFGN